MKLPELTGVSWTLPSPVNRVSRPAALAALLARETLVAMISDREASGIARTLALGAGVLAPEIVTPTGVAASHEKWGQDCRHAQSLPAHALHSRGAPKIGMLCCEVNACHGPNRSRMGGWYGERP